ncbi:MAG: WxL domain-containing protein [Schleiferilactobacillus harbinensis]|jgi:hypothetical protein|nr:WxL domain-containing protein [Schleiferilactobacillus harbinensis]MCI1913526.1 WxL domain-containing protein [Schleiferilactobacillus harbinensis]
MRKRFIALVAVILFLMMATPTNTVSAADTTPPAAQYTPSSDGVAYYIPLFNFWVVNYGFSTQPGNQNLIQGSPLKISMGAAAYTGWTGLLSIFNQSVSQVVVAGYLGGGLWVNYPNAVVTINQQDPAANITVDLGIAKTVGTQYFQFTVIYSDGKRVYSRLVAITTVPAAVPTTAVNPKVMTPTIFWGQTVDLSAGLTPTNSTASVSWTPPAPNVGTLTLTNAMATQYNSALIAANDPLILNNITGFPIAIPVKATNPDGSTIQSAATVTVGGLMPQAVVAREDFSYRPAALDPTTFPSGMTPTYQWVITDSNYQPITPANTVTNDATFRWSKVPNTKTTYYYLQLNITFSNNQGNSVVWRSNYTPLQVVDPPPYLQAVPNMQFQLFQNNAYRPATAGDLNSPTGTTLRYQDYQSQPTTTFDGNNQGVIHITGAHWTLSLAANPFTNTTTGDVLNVTPTLNLAIGQKRIPVPANGTNTVVLAAQTDDLATTLNDQTTLFIPQTAQVPGGTYRSQLTWTLNISP